MTTTRTKRSMGLSAHECMFLGPFSCTVRTKRERANRSSHTVSHILLFRGGSRRRNDPHKKRASSHTRVSPPLPLVGSTRSSENPKPVWVGGWLCASQRTNERTNERSTARARTKASKQAASHGGNRRVLANRQQQQYQQQQQQQQQQQPCQSV